jgi:hypothetical protein
MTYAVSLFILGSDYHLGDLLWFTSVLRDYREKFRTSRVLVTLPDRPISRILERNPAIDEIAYGDPSRVRDGAERRFGPDLTVHDLRPLPIGIAMVGDWRQRLPWLYYRDLWVRARGQWLATFLQLGELREHRPVLHLADEDRVAARPLPDRYVVLAPHVGQYRLSVASALWRAIKGWPLERWIWLAHRLRSAGYEPYTVAPSGQSPVPGTGGLIGLPIRQVAGVVEGASAVVTVESGLWFVAAALDVPFVIVPWWLPRRIDWPGPMKVRHARILRDRDSAPDVIVRLNRMMDCVAT